MRNQDADVAQSLWERRGRHLGGGLDKRGYGVSVFDIEYEDCESCGEEAGFLVNLKTHSPTVQSFTYCKKDANIFLANFGVEFRLQ